LTKILFIVPYPIGSAPSQRFRFEQYFDILKKKNYVIRVSSFWSSSAWEVLYQEGQSLKKAGFLASCLLRRCLLIFSISKYNFIFLHREALPIGPPFLEYIIARIFNKKIIYDFDDAIWLPNTSQQNSIAAKLKWHNKVKHICQWSWKVSCGNDFLAHFARRYNQQVVVNPTTVDTNYHVPRAHEKPKITIGWTGTHSTSKYLKPLAKTFNSLLQKFDFELLIISNQQPDWNFDQYRFEEWTLSREIELLNTIDIGIMPLEDTIWEQGKCGFKALQYMALEIPAVASDVGANRQIIDHGKNGFLCKNESDWIHYLSELIASKTLRRKIGLEARLKVERHYSVNSNTRLFLGLFA
jgi:glycosyltransferase involved in cell wall biosynthesis